MADDTFDRIQGYFGVPFRTDYVRKAIMTNGVYGLLDYMGARKDATATRSSWDWKPDSSGRSTAAKPIGKSGDNEKPTIGMSNVDSERLILLFHNDMGSWNVTRALRDCKAGKHKQYRELVAAAYPNSAAAEHDELVVEADGHQANRAADRCDRS